jgi:predicted hotdog family 3-hydroxylacyl-ACP dehydratase
MIDSAVASLIPHTGEMSLLERVVRWDDDSVTLTTTTHRNPNHPLADNGRLRSIHLCEYGAQAMAVHGGLRARARGQRVQPGMLVSLKDVALYCDSIHELEGELLIEARQLHGHDAAWQYEFRASHEGRLLAQGRAIISLAAGTCASP